MRWQNIVIIVYSHGSGGDDGDMVTYKARENVCCLATKYTICNNLCRFTGAKSSFDHNDNFLFCSSDEAK